MSNRPLAVGITGGIGAGKSIISRIFDTLGIPIYVADTRAKWLMANDLDLRNTLIQHFGEESFQGGELNRVYLARTVFSSPQKVEILNSLVHPRVAFDFKAWIEGHNSPYVLKEAALLFEAGSYKELDKTILVTATEEVRVERVLKRDSHRNRQDVLNIISKQWPEDRKTKLSDFQITNDGSKLVIPQVIHIHNLLLEKIGKS
jgi:dephospho-CoA kinase